MADPTLYLFDGYNLLHAGRFGGREELVDELASFVASKGVKGVLVGEVMKRTKGSADAKRVNEGLEGLLAIR